MLTALFGQDSHQKSNILHVGDWDKISHFIILIRKRLDCFKQTGYMEQ